MLRLKLNHVSKRGPWNPSWEDKDMFIMHNHYHYCWCPASLQRQVIFNTMRPRQNGRHFADDIFKCIFLNENIWILIKISLKFVPQRPINNIRALVQIMAWRRPGDKPLSGPMMVRLPTHVCVTQPQWVKSSFLEDKDMYIMHQYHGCWCPGSSRC